MIQSHVIEEMCNFSSVFVSTTNKTPLTTHTQIVIPRKLMPNREREREIMTELRFVFAMRFSLLIFILFFGLLLLQWFWRSMRTKIKVINLGKETILLAQIFFFSTWRFFAHIAQSCNRFSFYFYLITITIPEILPFSFPFASTLIYLLTLRLEHTWLALAFVCISWSD